MGNKVTRARAQAGRAAAVDAEEILINDVPHVLRGDVYVPKDAKAAGELFDAGNLADEDLLEPALQGVMAELGASDDGAKVTVHKWENQNGVKKPVWLFERHPSEFMLSDLQDGYGAGEYQIKVFGKQPGTNYKVIHANKRITIGQSLEQAKAAKIGAAPGGSGVTVHSGGGDVARAVAELMAPVMAQQAALLAKLSGGGGGRREMLEEMKLMSEMFRPPAAQESAAMGGLGKIAELKAMAELFRSFGGGGDGGALDNESGPWAVLMRGLDAWQAMAAVKNEGPAPARRALPAKVGAAAAPAAAFAEPAAEEEITDDLPSEEEMKVFLNMQATILLNAAKAGGAPEMYAGLIFENAPEKVLEMLASPGWFEELAKLAPEFANFRPWCEQVRALVLEDMKAAGMPLPAESSGPATLTATAEPAKTGANVAGSPTGSTAGATTRTA